MFVHTVYFWLKKDLSQEQIKVFEKGVKSLTAIESVKQGFVGKPASTDRPVIDRSYSYALTIIVDDLAGHDAYQEDAIHKKFIADCGTFWSKVQIYDAE